MEQGPPATPENADEKLPPKAERRSPLEYLQALLRLGHEADEDDDESLDSTTKKKRRFRGFAGRLLARHEVKKTTIERPENADETRLSKIDGPLVAPLVDVDPVAEPTLRNSQAEHNQPTIFTDTEAGSEANIGKPPKAAEAVDLPANSLTTAEAPNEQSKSDDVTNTSIEQDLPLTPNPAETTTEVTIPLHQKLGSTETAPEVPNTTTTPTPERVVERVNGGGALVALGVAELSSRHRDKKLRQTINEQAKDIKELAATQKKITEAQLQVEAKAAAQTQHLETARSNSEQSLATKSKPDKQPTASQSLGERQVKSAPRAAEMVNPSTRLDKAPEKNNQPQPVAEILKTPHFEQVRGSDSPEKTPAKVLEEVKKAAEIGKPIEDMFEHRVEVRDEPRVAGEVSGGISALPHPSRSGVKSVSPLQASDQTDDSQPASTWQNLDPQFKKAAISGFWTALVIIVILIIFTIAA